MMSETTGNYQEPDPAIEAAFPYALADNDRNRMVFSSGYRAGRAAAMREAEEAVRPDQYAVTQAGYNCGVLPGSAALTRPADLIRALRHAQKSE